MKNLSHIIQKYLGMTPKDLGCTDWTEMQSKMEEEINAFINDAKQKEVVDPIFINGKYGRIVDEITVTMVEHNDGDTVAYANLGGWSIFNVEDIDEMRAITDDERARLRLERY